MVDLSVHNHSIARSGWQRAAPLNRRGIGNEAGQQTERRHDMINKALLSIAATLMTFSTFSVTLGILHGGQSASDAQIA